MMTTLYPLPLQRDNELEIQILRTYVHASHIKKKLLLSVLSIKSLSSSEEGRGGHRTSEQSISAKFTQCVFRNHHRKLSDTLYRQTTINPRVHVLLTG